MIDRELEGILDVLGDKLLERGEDIADVLQVKQWVRRLSAVKTLLEFDPYTRNAMSGELMCPDCTAHEDELHLPRCGVVRLWRLIDSPKFAREVDHCWRAALAEDGLRSGSALDLGVADLRLLVDLANYSTEAFNVPVEIGDVMGEQVHAITQREALPPLSWRRLNGLPVRQDTCVHSNYRIHFDGDAKRSVCLSCGVNLETVRG